MTCSELLSVDAALAETCPKMKLPVPPLVRAPDCSRAEIDLSGWTAADSIWLRSRLLAVLRREGRSWDAWFDGSVPSRTLCVAEAEGPEESE